MVNSVRTWLRSALLSAGLLLLTFGQPAHAGHYTVSYSSSNGTWTTTSSSGPYSYGSTSVGGYAYYDTTYTYSDPDPSSSSCSGPITTVFTWVPDYTGDTPPNSAIITETSNVSGTARGSATDPPTVSADNGLGTPQTITNGNGPYSKIATSNGTVYWVYSQPGLRFTIPSRSPACSGSLNKGYTMANLTYTATATPVILTLSGSINDPNYTVHILIGQGCTGILTADGFTFSNYQWTVPGETFASFQIASDQTWGHAYAVTTSMLTQPNPHWYWKKDDANLTVSCTAEVYLNGNDLGFTVTGTRQVSVDAPDYFYSSTPGVSDYITSPSGIKAGVTFGPNGEIPGMTFKGRVSTPYFYRTAYGTAGIWTFTQLCNITNYMRLWTSPNGVTNSTNGAYDLDGQFLYSDEGPWAADSDESQMPPNTHETDDSPEIDFVTACNYVSFTDLFNMYMMYLPPGNDVQWVPLHMEQWSWHGEGQLSGSFGTGTWGPLPGGSIFNDGGVRTWIHPDWNHLWDGTQEH
ncbi:MAG: hypothetical protein JWL77_1362 [Chthonomonadaceae bacterium]|nr:hypothetical protein [Chthonomonadaceae bacterium]